MHTGKLIRGLVEDCRPVRPLPRPWIRTAEWLVVALLYVVLVVFVVTPRADLAAKISDSRFVIEQMGALATVVAAAAAAFATIIPNHGRKFLVAPFLSLFIWFVSLGQAYIQSNSEDWVLPDLDGLTRHPAWYCPRQSCSSPRFQRSRSP
jgi:hypothetical protein